MPHHKRYNDTLVLRLKITEEQADVLIDAELFTTKLVRAAEPGTLLALGFSREEVARFLQIG